MKKLKVQVGESLVEMLFSMLIISLGMLMLAGSITSAARLNKASRDMSITGNAGSTPSQGEPQIEVQLKNKTEVLMSLQKGVTVVHLANNTELYFYE